MQTKTQKPTIRALQWLRAAFSSCEPGWIGSAFLLPALLGSLALLFYVETLSVPVEGDLAGFDAEQTETFVFAPPAIWVLSEPQD